MMKYEVYVTRAALKDMNDAANYIDYALKNPQAADAMLNHASEALIRLARNPAGCAVEDDPVLAAWGIRHVSVDNYLAFFVISETERRVYVVRYLYYRRDWTSILHSGFSLN